MKNNTIGAFLELVRAGLWEKDAQLLQYGKIDYNKLLNLAEEQAVLGLVTAGLEHVQDVKVPQEWVLQFIGSTLQLEQQNLAMNEFIAKLIARMRDANIYTLLVKGQGIAQCYEKPLWRASGDVDLLLSDNYYGKAKDFLLPLSSGNKPDERYSKHLGMNIGEWYVEIHGTLRTGLSERVDKEVDAVQKDVFYGGKVRSWVNHGVHVFMPAPDEDVFFVFTHYIKHFYKEGMNLRQICDWCMLLWTYRDNIDIELLEKRIRNARLMGEWRGFASLAVEHLGMPVEAMPMFSSENFWKSKADKIISFILVDYKQNIVRDTWSITKIFPLNTIRFFPAIFFNVNGLKIIERMSGR